MADISTQNQGTVVLFTVNTDEARQFVKDNLPLESWQWLGESFAVESRFAAPIIEGMQDEGLEVE